MHADFDDDDLRELIKQASVDYAAYQALRLLDQIAPIEYFPSLKKWKSDSYLCLFVPPARPRGASSAKHFHRNALIVGEIEVLRSVGFTPTRGRESAATSACDVVSCALEALKQGIGYAAVETIWNNRNRSPLSEVLLALPEIIVAKTLPERKP